MLALIDVDLFKAINDRLGHDAGDAVLRQVALLMRAELREVDQLGRWGGEEFLLCAPDTSLAAAQPLAERLRRAVARHDFGQGVPVTVSIGLAPLLADDTPERLLQRADRALYRAKAQGRNRVEAQAVGLV